MNKLSQENSNFFSNTNQNNQPEGEETAFSLLMFLYDFLKSFKKLWWIVPACILVLTAAFFTVSSVRYVPQYSYTATFSVSPLIKSNSGSGASVYAFNYNATLSKQLSTTFIPIMESGYLQEIIANDIGYPVTSQITASTIGKTNIFELKVQSSSPQQAQEVTDSLIRNFPKVSEYIMGDIRMSVITKGGSDQVPYNRFERLSQTAIGFALGLLLSLFVIALYTLFNNTINRRRDVVEKLNQRCICEIPFVDRSQNKKEKDDLLKIGSHNASFSEAIRSLRKRVNDEIAVKDVKVLAITGASVGEGKSTLAYNLALSMANGGRKVLLLDMDFRHRSLHNYLKDGNRKQIGITDVISGKVPLSRDVICSINDNLDMITAGNENIKFQKSQFEGLFEYARSHYDCVIVDTPPCGVASESVSIADLCDLLLFVVRWDYTSVDKILSAIRYLAFSKAEMIGVVLNQAMSGFGEYAKYKSYSNYRRYGYGHSYIKGYSYSRYYYNNYGKKRSSDSSK